MKLTIDFETPDKCENCKFREYYGGISGSGWKCKIFDGKISKNDYRNGKKISDYCLTDTELKYMLHAIGYKKEKVKRGRYFAYRNYFNTNYVDKVWQGLKEKGFAKLINVYGGELADFKVTEKGMKVLESYIGCRILEKECNYEKNK